MLFPSTRRLGKAPALLLMLFMATLTALPQSGYRQVTPLDPANFDTTLAPCTDFYRYANGGWLDRNPVPPAFSSWGSFNELTEQNNEIIREILESAGARSGEPAGSRLQIVGDFFASGMDSVRAEKDGIEPLQSELSRIAAIRTSRDLQAALVHLHRHAIFPIFSTSSQPDFKNSEMTIASIDQSGLTLPDRDYYLKDDERYKAIRQEFRTYLEKMFRMLGDIEATAAKNAETVMRIETRLAEASMARVDLRDPEKIYNKMPVARLRRLVPAFGWDTYLKSLKISVNELNVGQPEYFKALNGILRSVPLSDWKVYLRWKIIDETAQYLSTDFVNAQFAFHGTVLNGQRELLPRWRRVLRSVNGLTGDALGQMYVEKNFPPEAKQRAVSMVKNLLAAFRERIGGLEWMSEATRQKAYEKVDAFVIKIGYPDKWKSYDGLVIDRGPFVLNVLRASQFEVQRDLAEVGKPVDRNKWYITPPTVNAYYNPTANEIVFPAGILQPPFFDAEADDAVNYGGMGAVIGHEITHGFDDQGRKFDAKGNLTDWWTKEDSERFDKLAKVIEDQYSAYVAIDSLHVNGKLTLGENIADLGGLAVAYQALRKELDKRPMLQKIDGMTPPQRFFMAWAQMWRRNYTPANLKQRLVVDPHSPSRFRTIGPLSNMPEFHEAFGCKSGDAMVRSGPARAKIW